MRRPTAAVVGMIVGTVLLVGAKLGTRPPADLGAAVSGEPDAGGPPDGADASASATAGPRPSSAPGTAGPTAGPSAAARTSATTNPPRTRTTTATTAPTPGSGSGLRSGTFAGTSVTHKYGTLQVTITVSDATMTDAKATYSTSSPVSSNINKDALPKLRQRALAAQSAKIATVSGATYTSDAYRTSLQSALDKAKG